MNTAMNYLAVLSVFLLLAAPSLYGIVRDRRIDRELRAARRDAERTSRQAEFTKVA
ncbi:hypothetical protein GTW43_18090 [Streptomyces sp. SID5785]|uniref:hypothetical protein n=1 Tax=Streptomyces sp. SID5785 TaxID=2690309 RepID=UPI001360CF7C|nr:hypothetical protein [Streptomyces sp. SID5785]MZD06988.1 hypothetical protein [Streptomyces sp. SID5785]